MHIWQPKICAKTQKNYECVICDYKCSSKFLLTQHLSTQKHKKHIKQRLATPKYEEIKFRCEYCNKEYKQRSGLWRHKKKCNINNNNNNNNNDLKQVIETVISNLNNNNNVKNELLEQLKIQSDIIKDIIPRIGNNNNSNNKFNVNVFLNEKCKNAVNMTDFVESLQIDLKDIDYTKNNGLINCISSLFISNLKQMNTFERPIHCTDIKRETLYIKDNDNWKKDMYKNKINEVITELTKKQRNTLNEWKCSNPLWKNSDTKKDEYISLVKSLMDDIDNNNIIKNIAKETFISDNNK
jgi:hypothetical protein